MLRAPRTGFGAGRSCVRGAGDGETRGRGAGACARPRGFRGCGAGGVHNVDCHVRSAAHVRATGRWSPCSARDRPISADGVPSVRAGPRWIQPNGPGHRRLRGTCGVSRGTARCACRAIGPVGGGRRGSISPQRRVIHCGQAGLPRHVLPADRCSMDPARSRHRLHVLRTSDLHAEGVSRRERERLVTSGRLVRLGRSW